MQSIPEQIKAIIKDSGKSQNQIARDAGVRPSTLQRLKGVTWGTQIELANKILKALNLELVIKKVKKL